MDKIHIEKNTVQETIIIPLYARKLCTQQYPNLFRDEKSIELIERLDYDFSIIQKQQWSILDADWIRPERDRVVNLGVDLNDTKWFKKVNASEGVVFDTAGKKAARLMIKTWVKQANIQDVDAFFYVDHIQKDICKWLSNADVSSRGYMLGYNDLKDKSVSRFFRLLAGLGDRFMKMQIIKLEFHRL